ncbi:MAG: class I SAM-dependent methyltransferase [Solirubrobacterales bacterium]
MLQRNGFEVEKVVNLSQHYAKTTAAWYQRMIANEPLALSLLDRPTYRAWQLYLAGGSGSFLNKRSQVYRIYCEAV